MQAAQMKFVRTLLGFTKLDDKRNEYMRERLQVQNICDYQEN
jgi:hypothetical protein